MPMIVVTARFVHEDGSTMWAFAREESVVPAKDEDPNEVHMRAGQRILDDLDAAKESIGDQIRATASYMGEGS